MRQEKDQEFAEMLKRWRVGITYPEDCDFLDQKARMCTREYFTDIVSEFYDHFDEYGSMMLLAHSNKMIGKLNKTVRIITKMYSKLMYFSRSLTNSLQMMSFSPWQNQYTHVEKMTSCLKSSTLQCF